MAKFTGDALIHEFTASAPPWFDDEGDQLLGWYYQFVDDEEQPLGELIGPYGSRKQVETACHRAWRIRDFTFKIAEYRKC